MNSIKTGIIVLILLTGATAFGQQNQAYSSNTPTAHHTVALEVLNASKTWINNFNNGNAKACVAGYTENAVMSAKPFGIMNGTETISEFWTPFIESGATNLIYTEVSIEVVNEKTAFLSANWSMNVGEGVIFQEKWEKIEGKWLLTYDDFQVLEQFKTPQENTINPIANHLILEDVINASISWTKGFNGGKSEDCRNGYTKNATMNAVPFASMHNQEEIDGFWSKLIKDGANNLTYHNPTFKVITNNTVLLSSNWSMNIGEGKIYQEKWEKIEEKWLLSYDEFELLKQY
ncbi:YybH family protein [Maribacter sp. Asnod2-G09]|uniref:YybH family protein n=1 Tax=Maribacter sp. Asnod2-G09 TaxID=3160577 RepID=UPI0038655472